MKKRIVVAMLITCVVASFTACGSKDASKTAKTDTTSDTTDTDKSGSEDSDSKKEEIRIVSVKDTSDYVTIGEYKGLTLDRYTQAVTDDDVNAEIDYELQNKETEVKDGTVEDGDTVTISYTGTVDGKEFDGGSAQDYVLIVGDGDMGIDGFEEGLIGMKKGETKELDLTLPEEYGDDTLSGKEAVFKVTLQKFTRASELTDEWVASNTDYKTIDEYKKSVREELEKQASIDADNELYADAWSEVLDASEIKKYPEEDVKKAEENQKSRDEQTAKENDMEWSDLLESWGYTEDEYDKVCKEDFAEPKVKQNLIVQGIIDAEGLSLSDAETEELKNKLILDYGVTSLDELIEQYGEDEVNESLALLRVEKFIVDQSTVNEKTGSPEDSIENEDAYADAEDTGSDLTEYDESAEEQDDTEENISEENEDDTAVEE